MIIELTTSSHNTITNQIVSKTKCALRSSDVLFFHEAYDENANVDGTTIHFNNGDIIDVLESFDEVLKKIVESEVDSNF